MAFCKNCGTLMENDICPNCGTTNAPVDSAPAETQPVYAAPAESQSVYAAPQPQTPPAPQPPVYTAPQSPYGGYQQPYGYQQPQYPSQPPQKEEITVLGWIWRFLLPSIPVVGWIINLIMLFIWMGDETKEESFRNWAKAQLIMMAIAVGIVAVFFFLFFVLSAMTMTTFSTIS